MTTTPQLYPDHDIHTCLQCLKAQVWDVKQQTKNFPVTELGDLRSKLTFF
jgi:hypothetical protein